MVLPEGLNNSVIMSRRSATKDLKMRAGPPILRSFAVFAVMMSDGTLVQSFPRRPADYAIPSCSSRNRGRDYWPFGFAAENGCESNRNVSPMKALGAYVVF